MDKARKLSPLLFILTNFSCVVNDSVKPQDEPQSYIIDTISFRKLSDRSATESFVSAYVDSIELARDESELPEFLNDPQFDYKHRGFWPSLHTPISLRAQIINRVNKCKGLRLIANSQNPFFKETPKAEDKLEVPQKELSFHDMVIKRISTLDCEGL